MNKFLKQFFLYNLSKKFDITKCLVFKYVIIFIKYFCNFIVFIKNNLLFMFNIIYLYYLYAFQNCNTQNYLIVKSILFLNYMCYKLLNKL